MSKNQICAIDTETTGLTLDCGIIEIAIIPLTETFEPDSKRTFHSYVNPGNHHLQDLPMPCKAMLVNGLSRDRIAEEGVPYLLIEGHIREWMAANKIRAIEPVTQNWAFDAKMLECMLHHKPFSEIFDRNVRDTKRLAQAINDKHPGTFPSTSLQKLAEQLDINPGIAHTAIYDAITCAAVYRELLLYIQ